MQKTPLNRVTCDVYAYWATKRQKLRRPLLRRFWPQTPLNDTNPHSVFRPRKKERYKLRKHRKNDLEDFRKLQQLRTTGDRPTAIFSPVGGGGMIAGISAYAKEVAPNVKIIGVEAEGANLLEVSLQQNSRSGLKSLGKENFCLCKDLVDDVVTVSTDEICSAIKDVFGDTRSHMEPTANDGLQSLQPASRTGAISVAGVKKYAKVNDAHDEKYVAVLAAANMDFDRLDLFQSVRMTANALWPSRFQKKLVVFMSFTPSSVRWDDQDPYNVTEFSNRKDSDSDKDARIWMSIQTKTHDESVGVVTAINERGVMHAIEVASNELAKSHLRHLAGGRPENITNERLFRMEFPEALVHSKSLLIRSVHPRVSGT
ncbi:hypothetical protein PsorP6_017780 [Peronosclerospora sorghi]|uniref:Uncharacterized protein n=1 Tax=Peronosclerospora sorghi TaxID=230839 RepID=A0ACC0WNH3_9STRA|nr:hypothetical protein PsorP6_017780 [Peronosclerospora sorghi]